MIHVAYVKKRKILILTKFVREVLVEEIRFEMSLEREKIWKTGEDENVPWHEGQLKSKQGKEYGLSLPKKQERKPQTHVTEKSWKEWTSSNLI